MTDRELLEFAAKAAGAMPFLDFAGKPTGTYKHPPEPGVLRASSGGWNPLDDDGDALRLAVKLQLQVMPQGKCTYVEKCPDSLLSFPSVSELEMNGNDPYAATRRAIARAAAEIGRGME
jgi:hypothetical protein